MGGWSERPVGPRCAVGPASPSGVSACVRRGAVTAACWGEWPRPRARAANTASWSATSAGWSSGHAASRARRPQSLPLPTLGTSQEQLMLPLFLAAEVVERAGWKTHHPPPTHTHTQKQVAHLPGSCYGPFGKFWALLRIVKTERAFHVRVNVHPRIQM